VVSVGLIALLDDVAALAKVAAASLDDAAGQAAKAGAKAAGVVIDDTAVTPNYVMGFSASRELPIVGKIAMGSVRNKLVYLLPAAVLLSAIAPWAIMPILMLGGAYLCFEGAEKVWGMIRPHPAEAAKEPAGGGPSLEDRRVRSAVQTDLILSGEIMAVTLGAVAEKPIWEQAAVLAIVGLGITGLVYGVVAVFVKADDVGVWLAHRKAAPIRALGRGIVGTMPVVMHALSLVGTAAMIWVGGGIVVHGLEAFGIAAPAHAMEHATELAAASVPAALSGVAGWVAGALVSGVIGLVLGAVLIPVAEHAVSPLLDRLRRLRRRRGPKLASAPQEPRR
jgi:predicted DNA repair protein MutK